MNTDGKVKAQQSADASAVVGVDLGDTNVTNNDLVALDALPGIKTLSLRHGHERITDAGMVHLKGLAKLQSIDLWDAGLLELAALTELKSLDVAETKVTPECVKKLQQTLPTRRVMEVRGGWRIPSSALRPRQLCNPLGIAYSAINSCHQGICSCSACLRRGVCDRNWGESELRVFCSRG